MHGKRDGVCSQSFQGLRRFWNYLTVKLPDFVITNNPLLYLISQKNFARNAAIATVAGLLGLSCVVNGPSLLQELKRRRLRGKIR